MFVSAYGPKDDDGRGGHNNRHGNSLRHQSGGREGNNFGHEGCGHGHNDNPRHKDGHGRKY